MRVLFASSELFPLIKTGGLGDVAFSLPSALVELDVDVRVVLPAYRSALAAADRLNAVGWLTLADGSEARVLAARHADIAFELLLIDIPQLYDRPGMPYTDDQGRDWADNAQRFARFSEAVALLATDAPGTGWRADVVHANDWQTGLVPAFVGLHPDAPRTLFTIHNIAYDCQIDFGDVQKLNLPTHWWSVDVGEFYGRLSMLKTALMTSDLITTVSPSYASEIRSSEFGYGYADVLELQSSKLVGVLNGIDDRTWDPKTDPHLAANYHAEGKIRSGKRANRQDLLQRIGAPDDAHDHDGPLIGFIGRMVYQKGIDLLLDVIPDLVDSHDARFAILGSGERELEQRLTELQRAFPAHVFAFLGYSEATAHLIEAGCDMFVMPSRYEPCGLNQMYSLRYGTPPIVRNTGGLADTVVDTTPRSLAREEANGFVFDAANATALQGAIERAIAVYRKPKQWMKLIRIGMRGDYGWHLSAERYLRLYRARQ
ncbi:MAG: glycogen synthase GlgA [Gammaproteobacteria bacterium]|nr:glycogen synthase GlgA [Gammaproteobacteria bacterium]